MNASIITIGNELLQGHTLDSNSKWIANTIQSYNINVTKILTIGDNHEQIVSEINKILNENINYLFVTGGLGPTHDDITKNAFCKIFSDKMSFDNLYYKHLQNLFLNKNKIMPKINKSQAMNPSMAKTIPNDIGSALGLYYNKNNIKIFIMPGVPIEMKNMITNYIIPKYVKLLPKNNCLTIKTAGIIESALYEKLEPLIKKYSTDYSFSFLPSYNGISFRIKSNNNNNKPDKIKKIFIDNMKPYAYGVNNDTLEQVVGKILINKKFSIAIAESCTGGLICKRLTDIPGSSKYFNGGLIAYNNKIKTNLLNIPNDIINKMGAVSKIVALDMAKSIKHRMNADIGISTTGISGPTGGSTNKPVGLVYIGFSTPNKNIVKKYILQSNRYMHREIVTTIALNKIRLLLE